MFLLQAQGVQVRVIEDHLECHRVVRLPKVATPRRTKNPPRWASDDKERAHPNRVAAASRPETTTPPRAAPTRIRTSAKLPRNSSRNPKTTPNPKWPVCRAPTCTGCNCTNSSNKNWRASISATAWVWVRKGGRRISAKSRNADFPRVKKKNTKLY